MKAELILLATTVVLCSVLTRSSGQETCGVNGGDIGDERYNEEFTYRFDNDFYLNAAKPANCTGVINYFTYCYYRPIPATLYVSTFAIYRENISMSGTYNIVSPTFIAERTSSEVMIDLGTSNFPCVNVTVDEVPVLAGDVLGVCIADPPDQSIRHLDVVGTIPLGIDKSSPGLLGVNTVTGCSSNSVPSNVVPIEQVSGKFLHLYAYIESPPIITTTTTMEVLPNMTTMETPNPITTATTIETVTDTTISTTMETVIDTTIPTTIETVTDTTMSTTMGTVLNTPTADTVTTQEDTTAPPLPIDTTTVVSITTAGNNPVTMVTNQNTTPDISPSFHTPTIPIKGAGPDTGAIAAAVVVVLILLIAFIVIVTVVVAFFFNKHRMPKTRVTYSINNLQALQLFTADETDISVKPNEAYVVPGDLRQPAAYEYPTLVIHQESDTNSYIQLRPISGVDTVIPNDPEVKTSANEAYRAFVSAGDDARLPENNVYCTIPEKPDIDHDYEYVESLYYY